MKVLFLYTELAGYLLSCIDSLVKNTAAEVHLVRWPVNKEAPFSFEHSNRIKMYDRGGLSTEALSALAARISPDVIYCSGWIDEGYLAVCRKFKGRIPVIAGVDTKWTGSLKQRLGALLKDLRVQRYFTHCWIPGDPQREFVHKLGFSDKNILTGFYSCDYSFFRGLYEQNHEQKKNRIPHRFIYAGRYYDFKGIRDLWNAFMELQNEQPNDWELWCLGTGDIPAVVHPKIKHFGFVQPKDMEKFAAQCGVFVLPSHFEPWGVVVHEFAAAGFPLLCSDQVGAASAFLREGENGFSFKAKNTSGLKEAMKKIIAASDETLFKMGEKSAQLGGQITPDTWSETLASVLKK